MSTIQTYLTSGEVTELLSSELKKEVKYYDLDNLIRSNSIPEPELIGGRRLWSPSLIRDAKRAMKIRWAKRPNLTNKRNDFIKENSNEL